MKSSSNSDQGPKVINIKSQADTQQRETDQNELILEK